MTAFLMLLDFSSIEAFASFRPKFGVVSCTLKPNHMDFYFLYLPWTILGISTILFMVLAGIYVYKGSSNETESGYTRFDAEKNR